MRMVPMSCSRTALPFRRTLRERAPVYAGGTLTSGSGGLGSGAGMLPLVGVWMFTLTTGAPSQSSTRSNTDRREPAFTTEEQCRRSGPLP
jgi:hypothetical protein